MKNLSFPIQNPLLLFVIFWFATNFSNPIVAACECVCLNGEVQAICDSTLDIRPICPPRICPIVTPSIPPIDTPRIPPIGTKECKNEQVYNEQSRRYEWQRICR